MPGGAHGWARQLSRRHRERDVGGVRDGVRRLSAGGSKGDQERARGQGGGLRPAGCRGSYREPWPAVEWMLAIRLGRWSHMGADIDIALLVEELCRHDAETEWIEFKTNNSNPEMIGQRISALANSACRLGAPTAYMVWGIDDETHKVSAARSGTGSRRRATRSSRTDSTIS